MAACTDETERHGCCSLGCGPANGTVLSGRRASAGRTSVRVVRNVRAGSLSAAWLGVEWGVPVSPRSARLQFINDPDHAPCLPEPFNPNPHIILPLRGVGHTTVLRSPRTVVPLFLRDRLILTPPRWLHRGRGWWLCAAVRYNTKPTVPELLYPSSFRLLHACSLFECFLSFSLAFSSLTIFISYTEPLSCLLSWLCRLLGSSTVPSPTSTPMPRCASRKGVKGTRLRSGNRFPGCWLISYYPGTISEKKEGKKRKKDNYILSGGWPQ